MTDHPAIDAWIAALEPRLQPLAQALRQLIVEADPDLTEAIKWSNPVYEKHGKVCYLAATQTYVSLGFFNGAALTDPERRMEGTGKKMRHAKVRSLEDIPAPLVIGHCLGVRGSSATGRVGGHRRLVGPQSQEAFFTNQGTL